MIQIYEKPCKKCGKCCSDEICILGLAFLNIVAAPCPALTKIKDEFFCGLIIEPQKYIFKEISLTNDQYEKIRINLAEKFQFGIGCDAKGEKKLNQWKYVERTT